MYACVNLYTCTLYIYIYIYTHTHIYIYIDIYRYVYMYTKGFGGLGVRVFESTACLRKLSKNPMGLSTRKAKTILIQCAS